MTETGGFDKSIVRQVAHRPWPMPDRPWIMRQTWHDLLFAHWPIDASRLRASVPGAFALDLFDGVAWLGIVPFHMTNVAPRWTPALPWISAFPELNVRTYVRVAGRPGIYFFSLDAGRALAVRAARALFNLPYYWAKMTASAGPNGIEYRSARRSRRSAAFVAAYRPQGAAFTPAPGTLEHFLTERYCLYHHDRAGVPYRMDIHHPPWVLQVASAHVAVNTMAAANGIRVEGPPALLHFARRQDMIAWAPSILQGAV